MDADGTVVVGHTRLRAAKELGLETVPVVVASDLTPAQAAAYRLADNKTAEFAEWDLDLLAEELDGLAADFDMGDFGFDMDGFDLGIDGGGDAGGEIDSPTAPGLAERFGVAPFSVLDARSGAWQERKRQWLALGIKSEKGRGGLVYSPNLDGYGKALGYGERRAGRKPAAAEQAVA